MKTDSRTRRRSVRHSARGPTDARVIDSGYLVAMTGTVLRVMAWGALLGACGSSGGGGGRGADAGMGTGISFAGGHGLAFYHLNVNPAGTITTPSMNVQASGSTMLVGTGHGAVSLIAAPTDNKGNQPYAQQDQTHTYVQYPDSGTALYAFQNVKGGNGFTVTTTTGKDPKTQQYDEVTIAAVEVASSGKIQQVTWNEVSGPNPSSPVAAKTVTTDGPATLVSFWWGDGFYTVPQHVSVDSDFQILDSNVGESNSFVQCAVAVKKVSAAGTYGVTWTGGSTAGDVEGAQVWLIAVE